MESEKKSYDIRSEETSKIEIKSTKNTGRLHDESLSIMMSETKKIRRRLSEIPRVVFADEELASEVSLDVESTKQTDASDGRTIETVSITEVDEELLGIDSHDALREIQVRTKKHLGSQPEMSRPTGRPSKDDEIDSQTDQESTRRSSRLLSRMIEELLTRYPQITRPRSYGHAETGSVLPKAPEDLTTRISDARTGFSENLAVHSMILEVPQTDGLSSLEAKAFACVLEESLNLLSVLEHVIPARVDERWDESYRTIDERYGTPEEPEIMFREDMGLLPLVPTVYEKIQRDRTYVYKVLKGTARDIQCLRRYDRLETEVDDIARILEGEHNLEINHEIWIGQVKQLRELIDSDRVENEREVRNLLVSAQEMNAEVDNAIFSNNSKLGYIERWEENRLDQQKLRLEIEEQEMNDALEKCATMEKADQIISGEVRTFLQANTRDLEENVVIWTSRYNEEIERLQQEINETKEKIKLQKLDLQNLEELRDERQIFLDKRYEEKELADREAEYWEAVNEAATIIQALWRGYMVRHKLGGYKKLGAPLNKKKAKKTKRKGKKGKK